MDWGSVIGLFTSGTVAALIALWGVRYSVKKQQAKEDGQAVVDGRRVGIEEFESFKQAYEERMHRMESDLESQITKTSKVTGLLRTALAHIKLIHLDMLTANQVPRRLPQELEAMLWAIETDNDAIPTVGDPAGAS